MVKQNTDKFMLYRDGKEKGIITNMHFRKCQLEGCGGWRIRVIWSGRKVTLPCSRGCKRIDDNTLQII